MAEDDFRKALSDFSFEVAAGGAIRHLADLGLTVKQIQERLDFPMPYARIQRAVWERLVDTGVILLEEPWREEPKEKARYVREYDSYGKVSFRRVVEKEPEQKTEEVFLACEFGLVQYGEAEKFKEILATLEKRQAEYIEGLPWVRRKVWHRADERMLDIEKRLRGAGLAQGVCYFEDR